ncbi:unnamed protein product [Rhodiola kirilowii]
MPVAQEIANRYSEQLKINYKEALALPVQPDNGCSSRSPFI